jgi:hypothetical protein
MRRFVNGAIVLFMLPFLGATSRFTVQQLTELLDSAHSAGSLDGETAKRIARIELKERLAGKALIGLTRGVGQRTKIALEMLADRSAFLDPPPTEIPSGEAPTVAAQQAILRRAETYTLNYVKNLPNLLCSRVVHRFDDTATHGNGELRLRGTFAGELTLRDGAESFHLESISDSAPIGEKRRLNDRWWEGAVTSGEFGSILAIPFLGHARFTWRHWQTLSGTRVAVIGYSVPESASRFTVYWCCKSEWSGYRQMSQNPACQGELSIDPDSGAVLRVTAQAVHLPRNFPIRQSQTMVEYRSVTLGGNAFLYPSRSLSFIEELSPVTGDRGHFLNRMEYRNFRRFGAESKLIADISGETPATPVAGQFVAPGFSAPDPPPISEPPAPGPLVDLTTLDLPSHGLPPVVLFPPPSIREGEQPMGSQPVFRVRINDVPVRVVVSDEHGRSIGDLRKEDFELFDDEKRQQISGFHVQRRIAKGGDRRTALETADTGAAPEQANEEIENAVFSREEIREIPLAVQLQSPEKTAKISASMHVGLGTIRFERQNGHNRGCFTATVSVFDNDGRYFAGKQERIELDYSDDKLAAAIASGTDVRADFDTPAGRYLVRVVIRDEDGHLSSTSSAVEVR